MLPPISYSGDQEPILATMSEQSTIIRHLFKPNSEPFDACRAILRHI